MEDEKGARDARRLKLLKKGFTDEEIARAEGTTRRAIVVWRNRRKLEGNFPKSALPEPLCEGSRKKIIGRRCGNCESYRLNKSCSLCGESIYRPKWKGVSGGGCQK